MAGGPAIDGLNVLAGTTSARGTVELADKSETALGVSTSLVVTPNSLTEAIDRRSILRPSGALSESAPRNGLPWNNTSAALSTGRITAVAVPVYEGMIITSITWISGTTALSGGTNQWFCLIDASRNVLKNTSDDTSTAWNASASKTLTLTSTYTVPAAITSLYVGIMVAASTVPTLQGIATSATVVKATTRLLGTLSSSNTGVITVGQTAGTFSDSTIYPYCYIS